MNNADWQRVKLKIRESLIAKSPLSLEGEITEKHHGVFLAIIPNSSDPILETQKLQHDMENLSETIKEVTNQIITKEYTLEKASINLCVIKDCIYIKNPLDWDISKDGVFFQWGNKYKASYMPYEIAKIGGDKIRIMDKLCCHKCQPNVVSNLWRLPEGLVFRAVVDWYK